jgi:hypothetical protein
VRWFFDTDHFLISKSMVVADLEELVSRLMQMENISRPALAAMIMDESIHHSMDDFEGQKMNHYEADAMEMAIRTGKLAEDKAYILHHPDQFPEGSPQHEMAKKEALEIGRELVNTAAQAQNEMNDGIFAKAPLPFMDSGELNPAYREIVRSSVAKQTQKSRQTRGDTDFNPFDESGKVVTRLVSTYTGGQGKDEGYARWYEPAAKELGFVGRRFKNSGRNRGKPEAGHEFKIPAHYVHHNAVDVMDEGVMRMISDEVKRQQQYGITDPAHIVNAIRELPVMHTRGHRSGSRFESIHNRIRNDADRASNYRQGLGHAETGEMTVDGQVPNSVVRPSKPDAPDPNILHESLQNTGFGRWLANPQSRGSPDFQRGTQQARRLLIEHHGFDEDTVNRIFENAQSVSKRNPHRRWQNRILQEIHLADAADGTPGNAWFGGETVPNPNEPMGVSDIITPPPMREPGVIPSGPTRQQPPAAERRISPEPAQKRGFPFGVSDPQVQTPPPSGGINPNQQVHGARSVGPRDTSTLEGLSSFLANLKGHSRDLLRSDDAKGHFEAYIEDVQMELAKTVIEDYSVVRKMSPNEPLDLAILSSRIQRPTNDVIAIYHTRGDWRNIAKSFGVKHEQVQLVKVALHG